MWNGKLDPSFPRKRESSFDQVLDSGSRLPAATLAGMTTLIVIFAHPVQAYLDPGSGVTFVSGLGGFVIGLLTLAFGAIILFFKKRVGLVRKIFAQLKRKFGRS